MIYDRPLYRPLGDMFVDVEFGDELHLALNFRVSASTCRWRSGRFQG